MQKYRSMVNEDLGDSNVVLLFDETGFVKKGDDSAGVGKQYCSPMGKVENCQVGVFTAYASRHGYSLLDARLFIPEKWFSDEYAEKRIKCNFAKDVEFKTKPQLAVEMFPELENQESIPFKYVVADTIYGNSPDFIEAVESCVGVTYFVSVPNDALCWLTPPLTRKKTYKYKGKRRTKTVIEKSERKPLTLKTIAHHINDYFWYRRQVSEERRVFEYNNPVHDPERKYIVDCRINGAKRPLYVFAVPNDDRCRDATITRLQHEKFGIPFIATAIFENQEEINRRVLSRFSDICEKQFPSLQSAKERLDNYLQNFYER